MIITRVKIKRTFPIQTFPNTTPQARRYDVFKNISFILQNNIIVSRRSSILIDYLARVKPNYTRAINIIMFRLKWFRFWDVDVSNGYAILVQHTSLAKMYNSSDFLHESTFVRNYFATKISVILPSIYVNIKRI